MTKVVAIVGPTAVGKTALSIEVAKAFDGEVISGDSMQVYRHLDIGTAKVTPDEMAGVPHHLIDICDIDERYSAAIFKHQAEYQIEQIAGRHHLPLIVGGTGMYLWTLTDNLTLGRDHFDAESAQIRQHWTNVAEEKGEAYVRAHLAQLDPAAERAIAKGNLRRVIRAIEVVEKTGQLFSEQPHQEAQNDYLLIGLTTDRAVLYERINRRVDQMMAAGLLKEARWLYDQGGAELPAGKGIGYHEFYPYFAGEVDLQTAVEKVKRDSRRYAKRQLTWFRNKMPVHWFDLVSGQDRPEQINGLIHDWLIK
ncbi:tRNA (adenosine(37)-N6)-dimethylallyltransferase MiaA [Limosilactobacillus sp.]|jgi:tRNA dimethylallyltransferase|uniref:tRNA (adenosine(37)-N6)-dimethylallyltransferase MiaA n=1 Tax=Limosilactobacillus sp. TaxID=2773925 RepID=UPI0025BA3BED|nr:tRNA (adenosine(37)-N6)-dimethylallyltransferase MiaA [Limosilactobacillus sp.]MCH3923063.1 tRNA (adenosine(37)-N6)-dimethylallyltransferase MiaA [Limosilactobacillus sp.]MCH3927746.1 tRNA (adenosine(37)-N6)-dimethylallyltransferase MiaA [Limosilactobacillus sp.]